MGGSRQQESVSEVKGLNLKANENDDCYTISIIDGDSEGCSDEERSMATQYRTY